jgi:pyruvate formate lyase activating enzyme
MSDRQAGLRVGGLTPLTTIDFPGELAAVVFCQGCPWRCRYCHNPDLLPAAAPVTLAWRDVLRFLERRRGLLDAVVFSGGEPTAQAALADAIDTVRALGYRVGLHTAGSYPARLARLLPLVDWIGLDIKALPEDYPALTGVADSGQRAWQSLALLIAGDKPFDVRVTRHPALLPPHRLQRLRDRLQKIGIDEPVIQVCRSERMLDPTLAATA